MHDTTQLELAGIPTVVLGTTAFVEAAEEQYAALGFAQGSFVTVAHPLGSMPLDQVLAEAERAVEPVLAVLLRDGSNVGRPGANGQRQRSNGRRSPAADSRAAREAAAPKAAPPGAVPHICSADGEDP